MARPIPRAAPVTHGLDQQAQVAGDGLVQGKQASNASVEVQLHLVDERFVFDDTARETVVVFGESLDAGMDRGFHQSAHFEQRLFQFFEFFRKVAHGGLSRNVR